MTYVCHSCRDEFDTDSMCDHFHNANTHQWCLDCCKEFCEIKGPRTTER